MIDQMADQWDYCTLYITWDERRHKDWVVEDENGEPALSGMSTILNAYGAQGWELVNIIPERKRGLSSTWATSEVIAYRAVFKRRHTKTQ